MALDALRGFDMFWIVGMDELAQVVGKLSNAGPVRLLREQTDHVAWAGFHFYDLIFPMFVFIVGASLVFSLGRLVEKEGRAVAVRRVISRALLMYLIGIFYYGGFNGPLERIRLLGVLQRIALAYLFAGLIFCYFDLRGRVAACIGLLVGYWALMTFVPVPGFGAGDFAEGHNLANWIDKQYLPWRKWDGDHDPEGLLSTMTAVASCLLGVFAGMLLQARSVAPARKVTWLMAGGAALALLGWGWHLQFPVIKKIWTSSFVLVAGGYSALLLGAFYQVIEIWNWRAWAQPFVWIGMNPITIYLIHQLVDLPGIAKRFVGGPISAGLGHYADAVVALVVVLLSFAICRFLYQRKLFLRL
ncbi:MAG TPA: DUF5009 domain-containing protein [Myxococcota bacterium]|nr:DUF5009 domain-containing protein [Myxococcota bacterium]